MSLSCDYEDYDPDWYWEPHQDEAPLAALRISCCSCQEKISVGQTARKIKRWRRSTELEEMRDFPDKIYLAPWYFCEKCGDLADSLKELGFCFDIGESLKQQIVEYRQDTK